MRHRRRSGAGGRCASGRGGLPSLLAGAAAVLAGCGAEAPATTFTVADSAGVVIVESTAPAWGEGAGWRVGDEPLVRIGEVEGAAPYRFASVTGALRLADGRIVVADGNAGEIRWFDAAGTFLRAAGRPGEGPGEFGGLVAIGEAPDGGVWAWDLPLRRFTWLDGDGRVLGGTTLDPALPPMLHPVGTLPDGRMVMKQLWGAAVAEATESGLRRDPVAYVVVQAGGAAADTLGWFPGREVYVTTEDGRGVMGTPPFAHNNVGAVRDTTVVVGATDAFELREYDPAGTLLRVLRRPSADLAVGAADLEAYVQARLADLPADRHAATRAAISAMPVPRTRPAHGALVHDATGHLWVAERLDGVPRVWSVLHPDGHWLGDVTMPPDFLLLGAGADWVLGVETDPLGVERVAVYPLVRG